MGSSYYESDRTMMDPTDTTATDSPRKCSPDSDSDSAIVTICGSGVEHDETMTTSSRESSENGSDEVTENILSSSTGAIQNNTNGHITIGKMQSTPTRKRKRGPELTNDITTTEGSIEQRPASEPRGAAGEDINDGKENTFPSIIGRNEIPEEVRKKKVGTNPGLIDKNKIKRRKRGYRRKEQQWEDKLQLVVEYKQKHNTVNVPVRVPTIGNWIEFQRKKYKAGTLSKEKIAKLDDIGFEWQLRERNDWEDMFQSLVLYQMEHNTTNVPVPYSRKQYKDTNMTTAALPREITTLGNWVRAQRRAYRNGELSTKKIVRLEAIGFKWRLSEPKNPITASSARNPPGIEPNATECIPNENQSNNAPTNQHETESNSSACTSSENKVNNVPTNHQGIEPNSTNYALSENESNNAIPTGSAPKSSQAELWEQRLLQLIAYKEKHNTTNVPQGASKLGNWVNDQRKQYRAGKLSSDRIARLESVDFVWQLRGSRLKRNRPGSESDSAAEVVVNKKDNSCAAVMEKNCDSYNSLQRPSRSQRNWEHKLQLLVEYKWKHDHTDVPVREPMIGNWAEFQRRKYKLGKLSKDKVTSLESIGFKWRIRGINKEDNKANQQNNKSSTAGCTSTNTINMASEGCNENSKPKSSSLWQQQWDQKLQMLAAYKINHSTSDVPIRHPVLGNWVEFQRKKYKQGTLSKDKVARLEYIGFNWQLRERNDWVQMYDRLLSYEMQHKTCDVPQKVHILGNWVQRQRKQYKNGKLSEEKIASLNSIGFNWQIVERNFLMSEPITI